jgi:uncharacterized protein (TIGR00251 family)
VAQVAKPWRVSKTGLVVQVRLTPKSSRDAVRGVDATADGPRLAVSVRAIPDKGEANAALLAVLAKWLGVPKSRLALSSGGKSRAKGVAIEGEPGLIAHLIENKLQSGD